MAIPYIRVAIYALTFITYLYSGYGESNIFSSYMDAIIGDEAVFGDMFKNTANQNCVYTCPGGEKPVLNESHQPSADGCGAFGMVIRTAAEMTTCCDAHDICYDTCNKEKELCDLDFKRCLDNYCDTNERSKVGGEVTAKDCKTTANIFFTAAVTLGCMPYLNAQSNACYCTNKGSNGNSKDEQYDEQTYNSNRENRQNEQKYPNYGSRSSEEM